MTVLLRVLGVELMAQLGRRLPAPSARVLTVLLGLFLLGGPDGRTAHDVGAVALLMGAKTVLDLAFPAATQRFLTRRATVDRQSGDVHQVTGLA